MMTGKKLETRRLLLVAAAAVLVCLPACRKDKTGKAELVADKLGRQEAGYMVRRTEGEKRETVLSMDVSSLPIPAGLSDFTRLEHLPPVQQGNTGTCWSHSTMSLLESELIRMGKHPERLSEMYIVYWEYVEKARRFLQTRGETYLGQGSEPGLGLERVAQYGVVRESDYTGLPAGASGHDHSALFREFVTLLRDMKTRGDWNEAAGIAGVRAVLDRHLGKPPDRISVDGVEMTPAAYFKTLGLDPADYVSIMSFMYAPFYKKAEFRVPDNWMRRADYINIPLQDFQLALLRALRKGYSAALSVDMSEPGYIGESDIAVVPSFDIPRNFIDQSSREFRFDNRTTTDDHSVHCVGYTDNVGENWFLIKDSWENAWFGKHPGYFFYRGDYIRLKCLMFTVNRNAVRDILDKADAGK